MSDKRIIFIVGPTAVGKTEVAIALARRIKGEIVSCDSMQVYRDVAIASNKPSAQDLKKVPHHLIDIVPPEQDFDVVRFNTLALKAVRNILAAGKVPVIAGGSGMYMQILLDGIFKEGKKDSSVREGLKARLQEQGSLALYTELQKVDRETADKIHPNDARRIIRALEVYRTTQQPLSQVQKKRSGLWGKYDVRLFALDRPREELYARINQRVDAMFDAGLVKEIQGLEHRPLSKTAASIIGIKEVRACLQGQDGLDEAKALMKMNTRRLAKRQLTWFRKEKRLKWIFLQKTDKVEEIVNGIERMLAV